MSELLAQASSAPPGCFVEVGVYRGGSAWPLLQLCKAQHRALYLYDTFTGIPHAQDGDMHKVGDFSDVDFEETVRHLDGACIVPGVFPASAVLMPPVAFAHLDCDQYRSVHEAAAYLVPHMVPGGVIWFDDSPCIPAAHRAARELFGDRLQISSDHGKHFVVMA